MTAEKKRLSHQFWQHAETKILADADELAHRLRASIPIFAYFSLPFHTKSTPCSPLYLDKPPPSFPFDFIHSFTIYSPAYCYIYRYAPALMLRIMPTVMLHPDGHTVTLR